MRSLKSTLRVKSASLVLALPEARLPALEISSNDTRIRGLNRVVIFGLRRRCINESDC